MGEGFVAIQRGALLTPTPGPVGMKQTPTAAQALPAAPSAAVDLDASTPVSLVNLVSVVDLGVDAFTPGPATKISRGKIWRATGPFPEQGSEDLS